MQIDLNKTEIELLDKALEVWETEARSSMMSNTLISAMLCPKEERANEKERVIAESKKAELSRKATHAASKASCCGPSCIKPWRGKANTPWASVRTTR